MSLIESVVTNSVAPISDDYSTDGEFDEPARIDHQHPLSVTLRSKIVDRVEALVNLPAAASHRYELWNVKSLNQWYYSDGATWILAFPAIATDLSAYATLDYVNGTFITPAAVEAAYTTPAFVAANYVTPAAVAGAYLPLTGGTLSGALYGVGIDAGTGQLETYRNGGSTGVGATSGNYYDASIQIYPGAISGDTASIAFYATGQITQLRLGAATANIYTRDSSGDNPSPLTASAFNVESSERIKKEIETLQPVDLLEQLRVVRFKRNYSTLVEFPKTERRNRAYERLNRLKTKKHEPNYVLPEHNCETDSCNGTKEQPCCRVLNSNHLEYGLIAEEVHKVIPEAVTLDGNRIPESINYAVLTSLLISKVQDLTKRIEVLESA